MSTASGIRARNRAAIEAEILTVASRHLAERGAAALSLRAIARDLDMVSSAIYRYIDSRDELLTRLIVEAYNSLGSAVEAALDGNRESAHERFKVIARATRIWAISRPHQYALIYGSPVPGYHAPPERTNVAGTRVQQHLVQILVDLAPTFAAEPPDPRLQADPAFSEVQVGHELLQRGLIAWTLVLGTISAELFEYFGPEIVTDKSAHFEAVLDQTVRVMTPEV